MRWSEANARASEIGHFRLLIRQAKSFDHLEELLVGRLNDMMNVHKMTPVEAAMGEHKQLIEDVVEELVRARERFGAFTSYHHGESVIREEFEELWDEVKKRPTDRDKGNMRREAIQVAAMAMRFVIDLLEVKK